MRNNQFKINWPLSIAGSVLLTVGLTLLFAGPGGWILLALAGGVGWWAWKSGQLPWQNRRPRMSAGVRPASRRLPHHPLPGRPTVRRSRYGRRTGRVQ